MAYCANCGSERPDTAAFCGKCGTPGGASAAAAAAPAAPAYAAAPANTGGFVPSRFITNFVLAFFVPVVALFLTLNARKDARAAGPTADALNRIALVLSIITSSIWTIYVIVLIIIGIAAAVAANNYSYNY